MLVKKPIDSKVNGAKRRRISWGAYQGKKAPFNAFIRARPMFFWGLVGPASLCFCLTNFGNVEILKQSRGLQPPKNFYQPGNFNLMGRIFLCFINSAEILYSPCLKKTFGLFCVMSKELIWWLKRARNPRRICSKIFIKFLQGFTCRSIERNMNKKDLKKYMQKG